MKNPKETTVYWMRGGKAAVDMGHSGLRRPIDQQLEVYLAMKSMSEGRAFRIIGSGFQGEPLIVCSFNFLSP